MLQLCLGKLVFRSTPQPDKSSIPKSTNNTCISELTVSAIAKFKGGLQQDKSSMPFIILQVQIAKEQHADSPDTSTK
jgi:hypothetical protein